MSEMAGNDIRAHLGILAAAALVAGSIFTIWPGRAHASSATPASAKANTCSHPSSVVPYVRNNAQSGVYEGKYYVTNDTWNASGYAVSQSLYVCNYNNWYVTARMNNHTGDGAVKTSPNVHLDFNEPRISSYSTLTSDFSDIGPGVGARFGIWEFEYDCWINGVASNGSTEIMIWTDNNGQTPSGSIVAQVAFNGQTYNVWKSGTYIAFANTKRVTSGQINLLSFFDYVMSKGWMPSTSTIGQIDYGVELVSTKNVNETFTFKNFDINT